MGTTTTTPTTTGSRRRRGGAGAAAGLALLLLGACSAPAPEAPPPVTVTPTVEPSRTTPPTPTVPVVWPLTGVATDAVAQRPAVAVKVENTSLARPQSGLEAADVVWETIIEFEVSRFVAVFQSQLPAEVGPIRSVRPIDPLVVAPLKGLIAYSGGQRRALDQIAASGVQTLSHDAGDGDMYRVSFRSAPHNVYGSVETFAASADQGHAAPPPEQFAFARRPDLATAAVSGTPATTLAFRLSAAARPSWTYDSASGTWLRSEGTSPATVASGARISAVNVVSVTANLVSSGLRAQGGATVPTYELVGTGPALVATGGKVVTGTWSKSALDAPLVLLTADGAELTLAPGNTWVELVPAATGSVDVA